MVFVDKLWLLFTFVSKNVMWLKYGMKLLNTITRQAIVGAFYRQGIP